MLNIKSFDEYIYESFIGNLRTIFSSKFNDALSIIKFLMKNDDIKKISSDIDIDSKEDVEKVLDNKTLNKISSELKNNFDDKTIEGVGQKLSELDDYESNKLIDDIVKNVNMNESIMSNLRKLISVCIIVLSIIGCEKLENPTMDPNMPEPEYVESDSFLINFEKEFNVKEVFKEEYRMYWRNTKKCNTSDGFESNDDFYIHFKIDGYVNYCFTDNGSWNTAYYYDKLITPGSGDNNNSKLKPGNEYYDNCKWCVKIDNQDYTTDEIYIKGLTAKFLNPYKDENHCSVFDDNSLNGYKQYAIVNTEKDDFDLKYDLKIIPKYDNFETNQTWVEKHKCIIFDIYIIVKKSQLSNTAYWYLTNRLFKNANLTGRSMDNFIPDIMVKFTNEDMFE